MIQKHQVSQKTEKCTLDLSVGKSLVSTAKDVSGEWWGQKPDSTVEINGSGGDGTGWGDSLFKKLGYEREKRHRAVAREEGYGIDKKVLKDKTLQIFWREPMVRNMLKSLKIEESFGRGRWDNWIKVEKKKGETEDEMVGWHHWLSGTSGDSEGQGSLACCSPWGGKESDTTEWPNNKRCI